MTKLSYLLSLSGGILVGPDPQPLYIRNGPKLIGSPSFQFSVGGNTLLCL